ncbi:MAG TPA: cation:proton antiporter [Azospirillaceae bacterium]|nr:cation:proton antiporter [Azospirillaceae bacterium]
MDSIVLPLFALAGLLALVSLLPPLAQQLKLPYTVLLAGVGTALGLVVHLGGRTIDGMGGPMGDFLSALDGLDLTSAAFLYIFLPVLLFETALAIDVRRLLDDLAPILVLAVVAVLVCTFMAGFGVWWAASLWYGNTTTVGLLACLLLGAIIATTDPAAVVGIFRDLGAPRRLSILVEGESLFNDAAAIALFTLLLAMLLGRGSADPAAAALSFLVKFAGGLAVGWGLGYLACVAVAPLRNMPLSEITLTVALAYLCFILGEHYLHVSGVVAVVTAALVVGSVGRTRISPDSWQGLEHVWTQLGFWANSLIFILASMLIPRTLSDVTVGDMVLLAALVASALVARAIAVYGFIPALVAVGAADRISRQYRAVMLWGGLRGAVSLALALAVTENRRLPDQVQDLVAVLATGFVLFTLFVNGLTLRPLIRLLGLDRLSPVEQSLRNRALGLSLSSVRAGVETVAKSLDMDPSGAIDPLLERGAQLAQDELDLEARSGGLSLDDRVYIGLTTMARREEELYLEYFRDGLISRFIAQRVFAVAGRLQDGAKTGRRAGYEKAARKVLRFTRGTRLALRLQRTLAWERPLAGALSQRFGLLIVMRLALRDLEHFTAERLSPLLGRQAGAALAEVLRARLAAVEEALEALRLQYPGYVHEVQSRYLARAGLRIEERQARTMFEEAIISREILNDLERDIRRRWAELERPPQLDLGLSTRDLLGRVSLFQGLPADRLAQLARLAKPRLAVPGELLVRRGERGDAMYFISSGAVAVRVPGLEQPIRLGTGDFFGEMALVLDQPRNADVEALGYCRLLVLDRRDFRRLYQADPNLRTHIDRAVAARLSPAPASAAGLAAPAAG